MSPDARGLSFFEDDVIHDAITQLASADSVVLYAGAGVTIDKTGLGWGRLIEELLAGRDDLSRQGIISKIEASELTRQLQPIEAASIASHYYGQLYSNPDDARAGLENKLQDALYPGSEWASGLLTENLLRLAVVMAKHGKAVVITTTNYDTHIEEEYERARQLAVDPADPSKFFPGLSISVQGQPHHDVQPYGNATAKIALEYLHGRIPRSGARDGRIALTEKDYYDLRPIVASALGKIFANSALLILGSSLTDLSLLATLYDTRDPNLNTEAERRFAIMPEPAFEFKQKERVYVDSIRRHLYARMEEFGVRLLMPHFFFQAPQYLEEVITAVRGSATGQVYADELSIQYPSRLKGWWQTWSSRVNPAGADSVYAELNKTRRLILDRLPVKMGVQGSKNEPMRLEAWVRWKPGDERALGLWSVSTGIRREFETIRTVPISTDTTYESMKAYVSGRPQMNGRSKASSTDDRWKTHLSVPVRYSHSLGSIPVGVVTLSSMKYREDSRIPAQTAEWMSWLVERLRDCGEAIMAI